MDCITLALGIICMSGAPPTAAESAAILAPRQFVETVPVIEQSPFGPQSFIIKAKPSKKLPPRTRLDGTPLWMPPQVYGLPPFWSYLDNQYRFSLSTGLHSEGVGDVLSRPNASAWREKRSR
ncbi:hypothetical protein LCGC14_1359470 [marine sediment metagenome]|uniref:Uncharacterized protein n=1 Tax=marine sediment metagenome TaxID=412755 RepID=A0A0F9KUK3_9ZZZZ